MDTKTVTVEKTEQTKVETQTQPFRVKVKSKIKAGRMLQCH